MSRPSPQTERVVTLIDLMAKRGGQQFTLAELSRRLGVHKQTCHSMLQTLVEVGWLVKHPTQKTYRLGPALVAVGRSASAESPILEYAHGAMHALAEELRASCLLMHVAGERIAVVDAATPRGQTLFPLAVGQEFPLRAPLGGMFVAWADESAFDRWVGSTARKDVEAFREVVTTIRGRGYDVRLHSEEAELVADLQRNLRRASAGERADKVLDDFVTQLIGMADELIVIKKAHAYAVSSVSAPVFDGTGGAPEYALSVSFRDAGAMKGRDVERVGQLVAGAAAELSRALGARDARSA
jgi:DNA-binding IclR family transcriptional regulator